jgi:hypothetical protein
MDTVVVAGQGGKSHDVVFRDGPFFRDHLLSDTEFFKVEAHGVLSPRLLVFRLFVD